jgi:hypothetical protein
MRYRPAMEKPLSRPTLSARVGLSNTRSFSVQMVTFTHTVSVFLLGLGTLFLSKYIVPDKIYPILAAISG